MIRIFKRLPGVIFMVLLLGLAGKEALSHQRTYSPVEKRELQTRPEISITKVLDGRFQKKYESYLRDQFPGRDHWVSFQTDMELFMGKMKFIMFTSERTITFWNTIQKKSLIRSRFPKICRLWRSLSEKQNRTRMSM